MINRFLRRLRFKLLTLRVWIFWQPRIWLAARRGRLSSIVFPDHVNARCTLRPIDPEPFGVLYGVHEYPSPVVYWDDLAQAYRAHYLADMPAPPHVWTDDGKLI